MIKRTTKWFMATGTASALSTAVYVTAWAQTAPSTPAAAPAPVASVAAPAAAPMPGASATAPQSTAPPAVTPPPKAAKPGPPAPTPEQLAGFDALKTQVAAYEQGAREYRETLTDIIKLHYGRKKRELLAELDRGIVVEKQSLKEAQLRAIARLEKFVEDHSGKRAHPESTPDAMFRLAALYEERARSDESKEDTSVGLMPAIALYKRIINEFPNYRELAGVYYFLGHAYNDSTRTEEAQQVWRSLVCHNHFEYPTPPDPKKADSDSVLPIPQDNTQAYWIDWRRKFQTPESLKRKQGPDKVYRDPYPSDCQPIAKAGAPTGEDPKYVQEVWWQIGNWEFDQLDVGAGLIRDGREPDLIALPSVYGYNRAASAYRQSLRYKNPNLIGVALYKYAWTLFKQQRYEAATREFVRLLEFTDEQQRLTGDPGSDFRAEAYTYIAGSLTTADFKGPEADEPYIPRPDVVEEAEASVAEKMLRVAIDRVKDPALIPQEKPWTIEIYRGLASEFRSLNHFTNAIDVYELMLKKWPMDPSAPDTQLAIAETYEQLNLVNNRPNTPEHDRVVGKVLEARAALANYVGNTKWVDANKDNPAAIQNAERLSKGALRAAAATLTNNARQALADAQQSSDPKYQLERLARALSEYRLAVLGWKGFIKQDENAPDVYESRYWLADAAHNVVRLSVVLHKLQKDKFPEPTSEEISEARTLALAVRDSNEDDKFLENSAVFVVDLADVRRDLEYQRFEESKGASGTARRTELVMAEGPDGPKVVSEPLPASVKESIGARDEYIAHVPPERDTNKNALEFQNYAAETYFLYGQFDEARARYEVMYKDHCGKNKYGYLAWEKLITMSNKLGDTERSRQLAEAEKVKSCAVSAEDASRRDMIVNPTLQEAAFVKARTKFKDAQSANPGPERDKLWREAAGMYEAALAAAPGRDEAPEAAMNAAYAYKQVGDYNKAIALYDMFIAEYGSDAKMTELQKGDPKAKKAPEPKKYEERVKYLTQAYDALSSTYYGFFNYQRAAETYEKIAGNVRFDEKKRKDSARNAMILYANMGARPKMLEQHKVLLKLSPSADEKANADFLVADYDYRQWNPSGADSGQNKQTRLEAEMALGRFHAQNRNNNAASKYVLEASYKLARMKRAGNDPAEKAWLKLTVANWQAFDRLGTKNADGVKESNLPPYADYGAEADFALVDADMREKFDYQTNHHRYAGAVDEIVGEYEASGELKKPGQFQKSVKEAENWKNQLDRIVSTYKSVEWTPAALARQGSVYDSIRTALFETRAPALKYFTAREENLLKSLEQSGRDDLQEKADQYRDAKKDAWRERRDREIAGADEVTVNRYLTAVLIARQFSVRNAAVQNALSRLAYLENVLGAAKMRDIVSKVVDPTDPNRSRTVTYTDDQFAQWRTGMNAVPPINGRPEPAPVAP